MPNLQRRKYKKRSKFVPSHQEIEACYHLSLEDAARHFDISISKLKKICRSYGIAKWPFRKLKKNNGNLAALGLTLNSSVKINDASHADEDVEDPESTDTLTGHKRNFKDAGMENTEDSVSSKKQRHSEADVLKIEPNSPQPPVPVTVIYPCHISATLNPSISPTQALSNNAQPSSRIASFETSTSSPGPLPVKSEHDENAKSTTTSPEIPSTTPVTLQALLLGNVDTTAQGKQQSFLSSCSFVDFATISPITLDQSSAICGPTSPLSNSIMPAFISPRFHSPTNRPVTRGFDFNLYLRKMVGDACEWAMEQYMRNGTTKP